MKKASWILLALLGAAITLFSLISAVHAYWTDDDYRVGPLKVSQVVPTDHRVETALRAIRGTSAAFATAYGVLFLAVVLGPYRRGDVWAWKALLIAQVTQSALVFLRIPILGTQLGVSAAVTPIVVVVAALLLDVGRLKEPQR